jgi:hypothetical protein
VVRDFPLPRSHEKQTENLKKKNNVKMLPKISCAATGKMQVCDGIH